MVNSLDRGIQILPSTSGGSLPHTSTGIVIISDIAGETAANNQLYKITNSGQARELFGDPTTELSLTFYIEIAQRYGAGAILAAKTTVATTVVNMLGSAYSDFGINPDIIVIPNPDAATLQTILDTADKTSSIVIGDFTKDKAVADIVTERGTETEMGIKHKRFLPCFGYTKSKVNTAWVEPLSVHIAGQMAMLDSMYHPGRIPSNQPLKGVDEIAPKSPPLGGTPIPEDEESPAIAVSFSSETADSEQLNDVGVITLNRREENGQQIIVSWGDRNALFPTDRGYDSLVAVTRINDRAQKIVSDRVQKFIDMASNRLTGDTMETSVKQGLATLAAPGAIDPMYDAQFLEAESDYSTGKLVLCYEIRPIVNVRLIQLKPVYRFTISTERI